MKTRDLMSSTILLILSILICIGAVGYGLGNFSEPGPGFFPFLLGFLNGILSILLLIQAGSAKEGEKEEKGFWAAQKKIFCLIIFLIAYGLLLEQLGYLLATFLLFVLILKGIQHQTWYVALGVALLASLGSYALFQMGLHVELPRSYWGI